MESDFENVQVRLNVGFGDPASNSILSLSKDAALPQELQLQMREQIDPADYPFSAS